MVVNCSSCLQSNSKRIGIWVAAKIGQMNTMTKTKNLNLIISFFSLLTCVWKKKVLFFHFHWSDMEWRKGNWCPRFPICKIYLLTLNNASESSRKGKHINVAVNLISPSWKLKQFTILSSCFFCLHLFLDRIGVGTKHQ